MDNETEITQEEAMPTITGTASVSIRVFRNNGVIEDLGEVNAEVVEGEQWATYTQTQEKH